MSPVTLPISPPKKSSNEKDSSLIQEIFHERRWPLWTGAFAVTLGTGIAYFPLATALILIAGLLIASAYAVARAKPSLLVVEIPVCLLLGATLIFRVRDSSTLASDPLDPAGLYRVLCICLAALLSGMAWLYSPSRPLPQAFRFYIAYVLSAFIAVPLSTYPALTLYRGVELFVCVLVVMTIWRQYGVEGTERVFLLLIRFSAAILISVWAGVIFFREIAITPTGGVGGLPFRIQGSLPLLAANTVGTFASVLFLWALAKSRWFVMSFALMTLLASQYRTGYVIVLVGILIWLIKQRHYTLAWIAAAVTLVAVLAFPRLTSSSFEQANTFVLRGNNPALVSTLTGRTVWWSSALDVWRESPLVGKGLLTATRFEALDPLGFSETSTIHNTWVEALVGTGVVGVVVLTCSYLISLWRARSELLPLLLLCALGLRTITGSTFEIFGFGAILFACLCLRSPKVRIFS